MDNKSIHMGRGRSNITIYIKWGYGLSTIETNINMLWGNITRVNQSFFVHMGDNSWNRRQVHDLDVDTTPIYLNISNE